VVANRTDFSEWEAVEVEGHERMLRVRHFEKGGGCKGRPKSRGHEDGKAQEGHDPTVDAILHWRRTDFHEMQPLRARRRLRGASCKCREGVGQVTSLPGFVRGEYPEGMKPQERQRYETRPQGAARINPSRV
jgi:hypothetical protein